MVNNIVCCPHDTVSRSILTRFYSKTIILLQILQIKIWHHYKYRMSISSNVTDFILSKSVIYANLGDCPCEGYFLTFRATVEMLYSSVDAPLTSI